MKIKPVKDVHYYLRMARYQIEELEAENARLINQLVLVTSDLRDPALTIGDWPADTVLGDIGVQAMREVANVYERLSSDQVIGPLWLKIREDTTQ